MTTCFRVIGCVHSSGWNAISNLLLKPNFITSIAAAGSSSTLSTHRHSTFSDCGSEMARSLDDLTLSSLARLGTILERGRGDGSTIEILELVLTWWIKRAWCEYSWCRKRVECLQGGFKHQSANESMLTWKSLMDALLGRSHNILMQLWTWLEERIVLECVHGYSKVFLINLSSPLQTTNRRAQSDCKCRMCRRWGRRRTPPSTLSPICHGEEYEFES